jgi:UDP-N-acetylmuramate: L-alanyl-gamma-D-glutamyl-meso-diaminopimelate ligase
MQKIHLISVTEPLVFDLALALNQKEYEVSVSGLGLTDAVINSLRYSGCDCRGDGWFVENITKEIRFVIIGATVQKDNPELVHARELGLLIVSIPEFIFRWTKSKTRIVVSGSRGKKSIISMVIYVLQQKKWAFNYAITNHVSYLPGCISLDYEAHFALIEGDERTTSALDKRFRLEFYRPHIAVLTNLTWTESTGHTSLDAYYDMFNSFSQSIEREGKLIYFDGDEAVRQLAENVREDITAMPYNAHETEEHDGQVFLKTRYGEFPVKVRDAYFLTNMNAARLVCRQLGVKDSEFYQAISDYSLSL